MDVGKKTTFRHVRPISRDSRNLRIRGLRCFKAMYDKLVEGYPCSEVARFIQDECKEYTDVTRGSLITQLNDFRSTIPKAEMLSKRMPETLLKAKEQVEKGLDELKELERLYRKQMERIEIDLGTEKQIKKLMPSMTAEVRAAREILESYAQIKMDLGLNTRHLGKVEVDGSISADAIAKFGSEAVARVLAAPESRRKVLALAQRMLTMSPRAQDLVQQNIVDVDSEPTPEGEQAPSFEVSPEVSAESVEGVTDDSR